MLAQRWDYRTMVRAHRTMAKDPQNRTDSTPFPNGWDIDIAESLPALKNEGWELVAISSRTSSFAADEQPMLFIEEVWVLKRLKR